MRKKASRPLDGSPFVFFGVTLSAQSDFLSSYGLHETATTLDIPSRWDPNTKKEPTGLIAYPAAHRRPVSGCGSQRMLHALKRRSHPADHGPSFASLFPPLAAVSSAAIPVRVKLKIPRANAAAATTLDIPTGWDPNTKKEPTGLFFAACGRPCSFDSSYGSN